MPLFQPTNITPDLISGVENGVVFVPPNISTDTVTISWTVNGNVPLVAYQIDFYKNNATSTAGYSTGKVTLGTPFSAIDANGNQTRFSCQVLYQNMYLSTVLVPRHEGKFKITQWWGATDDQSVVQRSLSVYRVNQRSSISVSGPTGSDGIYTFTGTFTPPSYSLNGEVSLEWTRWRLFQAPDYPVMTDAVILEDTGLVWGASGYSWTPNLIPPGTDYRAEFSALSSNGEKLYAVTAAFSSLTDAVAFSGFLTAGCDRSAQAVKVDLPGENLDVQGAAKDGSGTAINIASYISAANGLNLPSGASASWDVPLSSDAKWAFLWHGVVTATGGVPFFKLTLQDGTEVSIGHSGSGASVTSNPAFGSSLLAAIGDELWITFSYGTSEQYADELLWGYKKTSGGATTTKWSHVSGFTMKSVSRITVFSDARTIGWILQWGDRGLEPGDGDSARQQTAYMQFYPTNDYGTDGKAFFPVFPLGFGGLYRSGDGPGLDPVTDVDGNMTLNGLTVYDYSAKNGLEYSYQMIMPGGEGSPTVILQTNAVTPCFWNWALFEAEEETDGTGFGQSYLVRAYFFGCNLDSGDNGNGSAPNVAATFTPYPVVMRDTQNRHSGTLTALIGSITSPGVYSDNNTLRDQIRGLSTTKNTLYLRNRRGDFMHVAISGEIVNNTTDNSIKQELSVRIPWVEIGPIKYSLYYLNNGGANP